MVRKIFFLFAALWEMIRFAFLFLILQAPVRIEAGRALILLWLSGPALLLALQAFASLFERPAQGARRLHLSGKLLQVLMGLALFLSTLLSTPVIPPLFVIVTTGIDALIFLGLLLDRSSVAPPHGATPLQEKDEPCTSSP